VAAAAAAAVAITATAAPVEPKAILGMPERPAPQEVLLGRTTLALEVSLEMQLATGGQTKPLSPKMAEVLREIIIMHPTILSAGMREMSHHEYFG
jgi:hypothetical protein